MKRTHPTPWHALTFGGPDAYVYPDAESEALFDAEPSVAARIVGAVNAYESATAKAERSVVRAAMLWTFRSWGDDTTALVLACDRLRIARAKAKAKRGGK